MASGNDLNAATESAVPTPSLWVYLDQFSTYDQSTTDIGRNTTDDGTDDRRTDVGKNRIGLSGP